MKMIQNIKKILGLKKETLQYPYDFAEVVINDTAIHNGISDEPNKRIIRYRFNERTGKLGIYRVYGYNDSLIKWLRETVKIPVYDKEEEDEYPILAEIKLNEINYEK